MPSQSLKVTKNYEKDCTFHERYGLEKNASFPDKTKNCSCILKKKFV